MRREGQVGRRGEREENKEREGRTRWEEGDRKTRVMVRKRGRRERGRVSVVKAEREREIKVVGKEWIGLFP